MAEAKLYGQNKGGMSINGIIKDYYAYAGENISAGDLVEYINGVASKEDYGESVDTTISTGTNSGSAISAVALDDNRVFVAHSYGENYYLYGIVVTIDGANIIYGEDTAISTTSVRDGYNISTLLLPNGNIFIAHRSAYSSNYLSGVVITIAGDAITVGEDTAIESSKPAGLAFATVLLPNGNVFIAYCYSNTNRYLCGRVCTIDGTTITVGARTTITSSNYTGYYISACLLSNGNVFIAHSYDSNYYLYGIVCSISGTTITAGNDTAISSNSYAGYVISTCLLSNGNVFIAHSYSTSYHLYGIVCTIDSTTISKGTDTLLKNDSSEGATISTCLLPNGNVFIAHRYGTTAQNLFIYGLICNISNTTITAGTDTALVNSSHAGFTISSLLLNSDTIFIAHYIDSSAYLYAQIFGIDYENNIPTNQISITEYETQVRKVTTGKFDGIAKTSGEGGDDTGHKDIVSIWTKENVLELSSLPVGTLVKDVNSTFLGEPVIWKIADKNHEGYPDGSVTLITERSIAMRCFDAQEPNNSDTNRTEDGNNRYSVSNIRQWLNSDADAGQWYSPQHSADQKPSSFYVYSNAYSDDTGFLNGFSNEFRNSLLETTLTVALNTVTDGGGSETVKDKVFLASNTEVGFENENSIAEGVLLPIFSDDSSRIAYCTAEAIEDSDYSRKPANDTTAWEWWLRTPHTGNSSYANIVHSWGIKDIYGAYYGMKAVRPLCNISSATMVSEEPDEDGCYRIIFK